MAWMELQWDGVSGEARKRLQTATNNIQHTLKRVLAQPFHVGSVRVALRMDGRVQSSGKEMYKQVQTAVNGWRRKVGSSAERMLVNERVGTAAIQDGGGDRLTRQVQTNANKGPASRATVSTGRVHSGR